MKETEQSIGSDGRISRRKLLRDSLLAAAGFGLAGGIKGIPKSQAPLAMSLNRAPSLPEIIIPKQGIDLPRRIVGVNFPTWKKGEYQSDYAQMSLQNLMDEIHPNMVGITSIYYQGDINSPDIFPTDQTASLSDLEFIIDKIHSYGCEVMLTPHINIAENNLGQWHGQIGRDFTDRQWEEWFSNYKRIVIPFAQLAQDKKVKIFGAGSELKESTLKKPERWSELIDLIKDDYLGVVTYAAHYINEFYDIVWWDKVDAPGVNPYQRLTENLFPTFPELRNSWREYAAVLSAHAAKLGKRIIFPEIGYPSVAGAARDPWRYASIEDYRFSLDIDQQANCIGAALQETCLNPNIWGMLFWNWYTDPNVGGQFDRSYSPKGKPAARIIAEYSRDGGAICR